MSTEQQGMALGMHAGKPLRPRHGSRSQHRQGQTAAVSAPDGTGHSGHGVDAFGRECGAAHSEELLVRKQKKVACGVR